MREWNLWGAFCSGSKPPENDSYCLLTLAAIAKDLKCRGASPECSVTIAAGLLKVQKSTFLYQRGQFVLCTYNFFVRVL